MRDTSQRIVDAFARVVQAIQDVTDVPHLLQTIMTESKVLLDAETSSLFLYDPERNDLYFDVVVGSITEEAKSIRVPLDKGIVGAAATERKTQVVNDIAADTRHFQKVDKSSGFVTRNLVACPMIRNDRLIGVLEVLNHRGDYDFDEMDSTVLEIMAEHAAAAIENARLIQANMQAERLAALGTATASLAHYIKNILTPLKGSSTLIDLGLKTNNSEIIEQTWPIMKRATTKISKLVQDMLTVSREREPEREAVDLGEMIEEIVKDSQERAAASGIELPLELDPDLPLASLDPSRLHDSILNLVGNAIEALQESGMQEGWVRVRASFDKEKNVIVVEVEDNGPGMPPHVCKRIFEPFYSTKGSRGTGLGLAVVEKTIEEHGGKLTLESEVGKGTKFTIELPYVPAE
ncbi:GAF domain-containing protein [Candidatus Sumerlaeota bacterium]|nr:GAF domain-containing protein [Candidatus Sumerlaeota bacterium]